MTRHGQICLALEALEAGACIVCTEFLTQLSVDTVTSLEAAIRGEANGCMVPGGVYIAPDHGEGAP